MKKAAFLALFSFVAAIGVMSAASSKSVHAMTMSGTVSAVDQKAKTFSLKDDNGKLTAITWTAATRVMGGALKDGDRVSVSVFPKDGKNVATSIRIASAKAMARAS